MDLHRVDMHRVELHEPEVIGAAWGRCLPLSSSHDEGLAHAPAVTSVAALDGHGPVDSIVSIGDFARTGDLGALLHRLLERAGPDTDLLFTEPTVTGDERSGSHDITATLWRCGWSVVDCHRARVGHGRRARHYVWGRARPTRRFHSTAGSGAEK